MADLYEDYSKLQEMANMLNNISQPDYSNLMMPNITPEIQIPTIEIDEKSTFNYQMQQQMNQIIEKYNEHTKILMEQKRQLECSYKELEGLYTLKDRELQEAKESEKKIMFYNRIMTSIAFVSMWVAIAAWLCPNLFGGAS